MNENKVLREMDLVELNILITNARVTLSRLERLMGGNNNSIEGREFQQFSAIYKQLDDEMNERIIRAVYQSQTNIPN